MWLAVAKVLLLFMQRQPETADPPYPGAARRDGEAQGDRPMLFGTSSYGNFLADAFSIFFLVLWFWLLITVIGDLWWREDISSSWKMVWAVALIVLPYIGIFVYMVSQGAGMARRRNERLRRVQFRQAPGFSAADEITKLERLKADRLVSDAEYERLRARIVE